MANSSVSTTIEGTIEDSLDEEEVLVEPRFKYSRILGNLVQMIDNDAASTFAVHDKFLAVGFFSGRICLFDHIGNANFESNARHHKCAVSCISIESAGNYFVSCANDYTVNVFGIGCTEFNQKISLSTSAKVVAIASDFSRIGSNQALLVGTRNLVLYERGVRSEFFSGKRRETQLYKGGERDGQILAIAWKSAHIAFTNETGTRIYDTKLARNLTLIQPYHKADQFPSASFPPKLVWLDATKIAIGWANTVCVCGVMTSIKRYSNSGESSFDLPIKHGQILHKFVMQDFSVAGISYSSLASGDLLDERRPSSAGNPRSPSPSHSNLNAQTPQQNNSSSDANWQELIVFGIRKEGDDSFDAANSECVSLNETASMVNSEDGRDRRNSDHVAQLLMLRPTSVHDYLLVAEDTIEMRNASLKMLHRFTMCSLPIDDAYFLMGAREVIEICSLHKEEWESYVTLFERHHQVLKLVPVLPTKDPQLEPENYETILMAALYTRPKLFHAIVCHWNAELYRAHSIKEQVFNRINADNRNKVKAVQERDSSVKLLGEEDRIYLLRGLATLLLQLREYDKAIKIYLLLRDSSIFGIIERHKLFTYVKNRDLKHGDYIMLLMEINQDLTIRLLLDNEDLLPHDEVVKLLGHDPKIQMNYLLRLQSRGEGSVYSDRLVRLLAEHDRTSLLPFLRKNENYKLDIAMDICKRKDYVNELVYLLGRSGNRPEALNLMVKKLRRIDMAIDFCVENADSELWQRLIESVINQPEHIACLLGRAASININPLDIIVKISSDMEIPGLRNSLLQVLREYEMQVGLLAYSKNIAASDVLDLLLKQLKPVSFAVGEDQQSTLKCTICGSPLTGSSNAALAIATSGDVRIFQNGEAAHERCLNIQSTPIIEDRNPFASKG